MVDAPDMQRYVLSVKRIAWSEHCIGDALAQIEGMEGVERIGRRTGRRTTVLLSNEAVVQLRRMGLADYCHIEAETEFVPQ